MRVVFDIEANGFLDHKTVDYSSIPFKLKDTFKIHCIVAKDIDTEEVYAFYDGDKIPFEDVEYTHLQLKEWSEFSDNLTQVVGHNIIDYDLPVLDLVFNAPYTVYPDTLNGREIKIDDTYILSKLLNPDRFGGHSLASWGKRVGLDKISFGKESEEQWEVFTPEMLYYCIRDVEVNLKTLHALKKEWGNWKWNEAYQLEKAVAEVIFRQKHFGFDFDEELGKKAYKDLVEKMQAIEDKVEPLLPEKTISKGAAKEYIPPKQQFKKDFTLSHHMANFIEKHDGKVGRSETAIKGVRKKVEIQLPKTVWLYGEEYELPMCNETPIVSTEPMKLSHQTEIKQHLISVGWEPTNWKEKDLTLDSKKRKLSPEKFEATVDRYVEDTLGSEFERFRCERVKCNPADLQAKLLRHDLNKPLKVYSSPSFTVDAEKTLCPNLLRLGKKVAYVEDIVKWLTYRHRRNSIFSPAENSESKKVDTGWLTNPRLEVDGRIPTPADTLGCNCVTGDTLIQTDTGLLKITDVVVGDKVITHEGRYKPVVDYIPNGIRDVYSVKLSNGSVIKGTANHPLRVGSSWVKIQDLKEGMAVNTYTSKEEQWKVIPNFSNYMVSSWGRIQDHRERDRTFKVKTTVLRRQPLYNRRIAELVRDDGKKCCYSTGYFVLLAFKGERPDGLEVCHKDGNPTNNHLENLYFGTSSENTKDALNHGRLALQAKKRRKLSEKQVNYVKESLKKPYWGQQTALAKELGVSREVIKGISLGRTYKKYSQYKESFYEASVLGITYLGKLPVYDITVEEDHSFVGNGVVLKNTSRFQHRDVANIPKCSTLYGEIMRSLFTAGEDYYQLGYDADGLEARIEGHYTIKYKGGEEYARDLLSPKPNDIHQITKNKIIQLTGIEDFTRDSAKTVRYASAYGAQPPKLAQQNGWTLDLAKQVFNGFWQASAPLKTLKGNVESYWSNQGRSKYIPGLDGRKLLTRSKHSLVNILFQSAGVICMKRAMVILDRWLMEQGLTVNVFRDTIEGKEYTLQMIAYHDEGQNAVTKGLVDIKTFDTEEAAKGWKASREETTGKIYSDVGHKGDKYYVAYSIVGELAAKSVAAGGEYYKLRVPLSAGYMVGKNWADCH